MKKTTSASPNPCLGRRRFCAAAATAITAAPFALLDSSEASTAAGTVATNRGRDKAAIRPFRVKVQDSELTALRRRINATRWPERETVSDSSQGVQLAVIQELGSRRTV
jgi:hypothetical protein